MVFQQYVKNKIGFLKKKHELKSETVSQKYKQLWYMYNCEMNKTIKIKLCF